MQVKRLLKRLTWQGLEVLVWVCGKIEVYHNLSKWKGKREQTDEEYCQKNRKTQQGILLDDVNFDDFDLDKK